MSQVDREVLREWEAELVSRSWDAPVYLTPETPQLADILDEVYAGPSVSFMKLYCTVNAKSVRAGRCA